MANGEVVRPDTLLPNAPWLADSPIAEQRGDTTAAAAPIDTNLQPGVAALVLTGAVDARLDLSIPAGIGGLVLAGATPTVVVNTIVTPAIATLVLSAIAPQLQLAIAPATAALTLTGIAPTVTVSVNVSVSPSAAALTLTAIAPRLDLALAPSIGTLTLAGQTSTVTVGANVSVAPAAAALTLTGVAPLIVNSGIQPFPIGGGASRPTFKRRYVGFAPVLVIPPTARLRLIGQRPNVHATAHLTLAPRARTLRLIGHDPALLFDGMMRDLERELEEEALVLGLGDLPPA